ncbi:uncharacterized protein CEXT_351801 [Caerostris extrusa]|uniref:Uncharacterized protein n=1 Tax=Caerostris extrusa TaxID=172846 RepID=A0AAV4RYQ1_CAEEX|nr:uncharacterized protein CEXT_351801 [Caerostris extrusa]
MSICRTHTIGIRRFIKEIEYDASLIEHHLIFTRQILPFNHDNIWHDSKWIVDDEIDEYLNYRIQSRHAMSVSKKDINPRMRASAPNIRNVDQQEISVLFSPVTNNLGYRDDQSVASDFEWNYNREDKSFIPVRRVIQSNKSVPVDSTITPHTMSDGELLHHFSKLNSRLRFSSYSLQRWYASFMSLVMLRCSTYLVRWLENPATISDLLQFFLPLGMLVILSTSIAEVNFESKRVLRSIYPNEERIRPLQYMNLNPLQLSVYGFGVTHGTIVTVVIAMLVAFVSQVVITEMTQV